MMSQLKYKLSSLALALTLSPVAVVKAQGGVTSVAPPSTIDVPGLVNTTMNWAFGLLIVLATAFILYAAYLYLLAGQNPDNQGKAKNFILYAVIAIVIGFVARGLVSIVVDLLQ